MAMKQLSIETGESFDLLEGWERLEEIHRLKARGLPVDTRGRGGLRVYRHRDGKTILTVRRTAPGRIVFRQYGAEGRITLSDLATLLPLGPAQPRLSRTGVQKPK